MSANNIILIGFMGSGKSSVGRLLAKKTGSNFLDTDTVIEMNEGRSISDIFDEKGEKYFRELEVQTVEWLRKNVNESVISTGGGMLVHCKGLEEIGKIIYLKVPFETIMSRLSPSELASRPLFKNAEEAKQIYLERSAVYEERADVIIEADTDIDTVLSRLMDAISL